MGEFMVEEPVTEGKMGETAAGVGNLEVSISFGRFDNDLLSWERWSSFSQNKYLEEVEKCSTPGSVAEKKAYFEAHYKKVAAKKAEIEDQQKQVEASLLVAAKNNGESSTVIKKEETKNELKQLVADSWVEEKPIGESVAAENDEIGNQQKQVEVNLIAEEPSGAYPIQRTQNVTAHFQSPDSQTDHIQLVKALNSLNNERGIKSIGEQANDGGTYGVGACQTKITDEKKQERNLSSETTNDVVGEVEHEIHFKDSPSLVEAPTETEITAGEVLKSSTKEMTKLKPQNMTKVLLTNTERVRKVKKAPTSLAPKSPQISSLTPKMLMPKSTPSMISASRSSALKGSKSCVSISKSSYAEHKKLTATTNTVSLNLSSARSTPATATRKPSFMEKMGDKDTVKRASSSVLPNLGHMTSPGERSDSLPKLVTRTTKKIQVEEPLTSQKGKEWLLKTGVISANVAQAAPTLASSRSDMMAQKGKEMKKVTRNPNVKVAAGSQARVESKKVNESTTNDSRKSHKFKATPLPAFYRGTGVSKSLLCKENHNTSTPDQR
ncbi:unnamed protein product [Rhodiola kirilowii]